MSGAAAKGFGLGPAQIAFAAQNRIRILGRANGDVQREIAAKRMIERPVPLAVLIVECGRDSIIGEFGLELQDHFQTFQQYT